MDNSFSHNHENDQLSYKYNTPKETEKSRSPKINPKYYSPKKQRKESSFAKKKFSLVDEIDKSREDKNAKKDNMLKGPMPDDPKQMKNEGKIKKKDAANRKFMRKNAKNYPKKKRENNTKNTIKVVGPVSAKLNALIQRLEQNNASNENENSDQGENKYVMAPRIKAALEKFNKKKEEKPEIFHFGDGKRSKRKNKINEEKKDNKENSPDGYNYEDNNEEEEYEEDEDYEEEDDEEEEEIKEKEDNGQKNKKVLRNSVKRPTRKKRTRDKDEKKITMRIKKREKKEVRKMKSLKTKKINMMMKMIIVLMNTM